MEILVGKKTPKKVVITGMHKSGTTLLAEWFYNSGHDVVDYQALKDGKEYRFGNQYERLYNLNINNMALGMRGKNSLFLPKRDTDIPLIELIKSTRFNGAGYKVVKDPRISLLLDDYCAAWPGSNYIFIYRNPSEVASRYSSRNYFNRIKALRAWLKYNNSIIEFIEKSTKDCELFLISYYVLLSSSQEQKRFAEKYQVDEKIFKNRSGKQLRKDLFLLDRVIDLLFFKGRINKVLLKLNYCSDLCVD